VIVLTSQAVGEPDFQVHGIFPSYAAAALHVRKDADLGPIRFGKLAAAWHDEAAEKQETVQIGFGNKEEHWCASRQPMRGEDGL
jgi:hypothetical protein